MELTTPACVDPWATPEILAVARTSRVDEGWPKLLAAPTRPDTTGGREPTAKPHGRKAKPALNFRRFRSMLSGPMRCRSRAEVGRGLQATGRGRVADMCGGG